MDPVSLIAGVAVGAAVGFGAALGGSKKKAAELSSRVQELEDAESKAKKQLQAGESSLKKAEQSAAELEKKLKKEKKVSKDADSAAKSSKQALDKAKKDVRSAKDQAKKASTDAASNAEEAARLKKDLDDAGITNAAKFDDVKGDLNGILKVLCEHEKQQAAVLSDQNGIVVAAFGSKDIQEGMAAATSRITKIGTHLSGIVDFGQIATFRLGDEGQTVIAGRTVELHGEIVALATMGAKIPSDKSLDGAIDSLSAALA